MKVIKYTGKENIALLYIGQSDNGKFFEFVESFGDEGDINKKWVIIVSTLYGCPVKCKICDAGFFYDGKINKDDIISQIDFLVSKRFPDRFIHSDKFKIQFARMGEPSFNHNVLDVLDIIDTFYKTKNLIISLSTVYPLNTNDFFNRLLKIKKEKYLCNFQLQFSIHTTDIKIRDELIPVPKNDFKKINNYGKRFFDGGGKKITLNFALAENMPVCTETLAKYFNPEIFLIKITPVNPTAKAKKHEIKSENIDLIKNKLCEDLNKYGFEVIISIGILEENKIGSNCGQFLTEYLKSDITITGAYTYNPENL